MDQYSTSEISEALVSEIKKTLSGKDYGSVEIYVESGRVVQITERRIKKTSRMSDNDDKKNEVIYWKPIRNKK